jgi:hypothetical protein
MRVLLTGSRCLGAAMHPPLAETSIPAAGSGPFSAGSGSIHDIQRPR